MTTAEKIAERLANEIEAAMCAWDDDPNDKRAVEDVHAAALLDAGLREAVEYIERIARDVIPSARPGSAAGQILAKLTGDKP